MKISLRTPVRFNKFKDFYGFGKVFHALTEALSNRRGIELLAEPDNADVQICLCMPDIKWEFFPWWGIKRHKRQAIYSVWETTKIPYGWAEVMNTGVAALTASTWCADIFEKCGVEVPVHVVPHGVNPAKFPYLERDWHSEKFYFLCQCMHPYDRKGLRYARQAFDELNLKDAWLIEKWYPMVSRNWGPTPYPSARRIEIGQFMEREQYLDLLQHCHVSINPFRGEGFGLMPLETAATGMFTIATNFSGPTDYIRPDCFWPLKYQLSNPQEDYISTSLHVDYITAPAQDAEPDVEDLKAAMLWAYNNRDEARERGKKAREYIAQEWTWEKAADRFIEVCEKINGL